MTEPDGSAMFRAPAEAYDRYVGRYSRQLARALIAAAGVRSGHRALDVGCGPGALTTELVALLGADHVAAVEPSPTFAEACRQRNPDVRVVIAPAEDLPFDDDSFDAALAQLVVNFMSDAHAGVREMQRVTRPSGTLAAAVWDYAGEMTLLRRFWDAAVALDPLAEANDGSRSMRFCTPDGLRELWSAGGLVDIDVRSVTVAASYEGFEDLWQPLEVGVGPAGAYTVSLARDRRLALKAEVRRRLAVGDDPFELTARAWLVIGRVGPAAS